MRRSQCRSVRAIPFIVTLVALFGCSSGSAPHDVAMSVPLGSSILELDQYLQRGRGSEGTVYVWQKTPGKGEYLIGSYSRLGEVEVGDYDEWVEAANDRDKFTGRILFIHDSLTSSDANELAYVNGKLVDRGWGFLPG